MKRRILVWLLVLLLAMGAAAAEVIDGLGRAVSLDRVPERIVSLTPANTEILYALGVGDKVVGADTYSDYPAEAAAIPRMGDYSGPNVELIAAAQPDVVFASTKLQIDAVEKLESLGLTVVCVEPDDYGEVLSGIARIARIVGADPGPLLEEITDKQVAALSAIDRGVDAPTVYFALSFGEFGDYSAGPGTFLDELIRMAGAKNAAADAQYAWPMYSPEGIVALDPDVILISDYVGDGAVVEQFAALPNYAGLRAVKEGRVYAVDEDLVSRPGPRIVEGLSEIVGALYQ
ncbi:MAG: ABC transporter substrate-binding protein [Clostridiales bacterium]|nr:ABC transporter substrate-binding protein [Clostridiales bacterium]OPZ69883.1 MAG: Vitamin B12-binding protein precursor [Firmicutes bacterium ADurb.Bin467]